MLLLLLACTPRPDGFPTINGDPDQSWPALPDLDDQIVEIMEQDAIAGLSACMVIEGETRWCGGYGDRDPGQGLPAYPSTPFLLASVSKTVGAVDSLREVGVPYISVLAHPTTGGVIASFASLGDVVVAEPGALLSFAGPRVVEQTTGEKTAPDFGRSESNLRLGQLDAVVPRRELRGELAKLLMLFSPAEDEPTGDNEPLPPTATDENPVDRVLGMFGLGRKRG